MIKFSPMSKLYYFAYFRLSNIVWRSNLITLFINYIVHFNIRTVALLINLAASITLFWNRRSLYLTEKHNSVIEGELYKHEAIYLSVHCVHLLVHSSFVKSFRPRLTISIVILLSACTSGRESIHIIWRYIRIAILCVLK